MNKTSERKSAAARLEAQEQLNLQKQTQAKLRLEKDEERELEALKTVKLRELRLAREAAMPKTVPKPRAARRKTIS